MPSGLQSKTMVGLTFSVSNHTHTHTQSTELKETGNSLVQRFSNIFFFFLNSEAHPSSSLYFFIQIKYPIEPYHEMWIHVEPAYLGAHCPTWGFPGDSAVKNLPSTQESQKTWVRSLVWEDPLEERMATHSSIWTGWWATAHGVAESWTQLKQLSTILCGGRAVSSCLPEAYQSDLIQGCASFILQRRKSGEVT